MKDLKTPVQIRMSSVYLIILNLIHSRAYPKKFTSAIIVFIGRILRVIEIKSFF